MEEALELAQACRGNPLKICVSAPAWVSGEQNKQGAGGGLMGSLLYVHVLVNILLMRFMA
eukprot:1148238-Pelagomonas_calceolata.AAC.3